MLINTPEKFGELYVDCSCCTPLRRCAQRTLVFSFHPHQFLSQKPILLAIIHATPKKTVYTEEYEGWHP
jgi:hypothetical protein